MSLCTRPIDPIDAQALAAGAEPIFASDAGKHARDCAACGEQVALAGRLDGTLEGTAVGPAMPDLSSRVVRLRAFSRRERRDFSLWRAACGLSAGVFFGGLLLLTLPVLTVREQAGLGGMALLAPLWMLVKTLQQALGQAAVATPSGLQALSETLRQHTAVGLAALALLAPTVLGLKRALARARH